MSWKKEKALEGLQERIDKINEDCKDQRKRIYSSQYTYNRLAYSR